MARVGNKKGKATVSSETLRSYGDGTATVRRTKFNKNGTITQENRREGKGTGINKSTHGAG